MYFCTQNVVLDHFEDTFSIFIEDHKFLYPQSKMRWKHFCPLFMLVLGLWLAHWQSGRRTLPNLQRYAHTDADKNSP